MKDIIIQSRKIGKHHPCFIIAEGCDNHLGNMDTAKEMVRHAKSAGADAIKFQHHLPDEEMLRDGVPMSANFNMPLYEFLQLYALTLDQHRELKRYCDELGIIYLCTPFSKKAALEIADLVPAFKIGSGELTDIPSLKVIASLGKPVILSSGMSVYEEIDETINALKPINEDLLLMNCTSEYPPKYEDINLGVIKKLEERYDIPIGHSDHTPDIYTCFGAVAMGAKLIEKHIILDRKQPGPDQSVSIEPFELYQMVSGIRKIEAAMGAEKKINDLEKPIRSWAHRSIVTLKDIPAGTLLTEELIWTKRPGTGVPAKHIDSFIGKKVTKDLTKDYLITWDDIER
ncbi:MAG: CMP-N-acetylneuraminic acid synthetase [Sphingobacteriales bacterium]|nr:MAG: CMP-N-acetylneuraminic acid synthetase [Sphingobacteriales bacterium]